MTKNKNVELDADKKFVPYGIVTYKVEFEPRKSKAKLYDIDQIKNAIRSGNKYAFPENVTISTVFKVLKELKKIDELKTITYGKLKDTGHELTTKKGRVYINYQYVIYLP